NQKILDYNMVKGKYYGWFLCDYANAALFEKIYKSNVFVNDSEFESKYAVLASGGYISSMCMCVYPYKPGVTKTSRDKLIDTCKKQISTYTFHNSKFKCLDYLYNESSKGDTYVVCIGYLTTTDPNDAIRAVKWTHFDSSQSKPDQAVITELSKDKFNLVENICSWNGNNWEKQYGWAPRSEYQKSNFNMGTDYPVVNLWYSKDSALGEPLYGITPISGQTAGYEQQIANAVAQGMVFPRDQENYIFSCNLGSPESENQFENYFYFKRAGTDKSKLPASVFELKSYRENINAFR
ncbi:MAG: hypothetical protein MJ189_06000, partial [Coriobacteriales bacterium]|nr:hypothetical protein [Coriobacteriales bacterium]